MTTSHDDPQLKAQLLAALKKVYDDAKKSVTVPTGKFPTDVKTNDGWLFNSRKEEIDIFIKEVSGTPLNGSKGVGIINAPASVVSYIFNTTEGRNTWDEMWKSGREIEKTSESAGVSYNAFNAPWPVTPRDFLAVGCGEVWEDGSIFTYSTSTEHPACPNDKNHIRGILIFCGLLVTPLSDRQCRVTYTLMSDPCGSLPTFLVNAANISQPLCIHAVRKLCAKPGMIEKYQKDMEVSKAKRAAYFEDLKKQQTEGVQGQGAGQGGKGDGSGGGGGGGGGGGDGTFDFPFDRSVGKTPYEDKLEQTRVAAIKAVQLNEEDGWVFHTEQKGVKIYMKAVPGQPVNFSKGIYTIDYSAEEVKDVFSCGEIRSQWDGMFEQSVLLQVFDAHTSMGYSSFKAPWPIQSRDFCTCGRWIKNSKGNYLLYYTSVESAQAPVSTKYARGTLIFSSLLIEPLGANKCRVIYALGSDPGGSLPTWAVNATAVAQPLCMFQINELMTKNPQVVAKAKKFELAKWARLNDTAMQGGNNEHGDKVVDHILKTGSHLAKMPWTDRKFYSITLSERSSSSSTPSSSSSAGATCVVAPHDLAALRGALPNTGLFDTVTVGTEIAKLLITYPTRLASSSSSSASSATLASPSSDYIGVLRLRIACVVGSYLCIFPANCLYMRVSVEGRRYRTDFGVFYPNEFVIPVHSTASVLKLELIATKGSGSMVIGKTSALVGELCCDNHSTHGWSRWDSLHNIPWEVDRAAERKMKQKKHQKSVAGDADGENDEAKDDTEDAAAIDAISGSPVTGSSSRTSTEFNGSGRGDKETIEALAKEKKACLLGPSGNGSVLKGLFVKSESSFVYFPSQHFLHILQTHLAVFSGREKAGKKGDRGIGDSAGQLGRMKGGDRLGGGDVDGDDRDRDHGDVDMSGLLLPDSNKSEAVGDEHDDDDGEIDAASGRSSDGGVQKDDTAGMFDYDFADFSKKFATTDGLRKRGNRAALGPSGSSSGSGRSSLTVKSDAEILLERKKDYAHMVKERRDQAPYLDDVTLNGIVWFFDLLRPCEKYWRRGKDLFSGRQPYITFFLLVYVYVCVLVDPWYGVVAVASFVLYKIFVNATNHHMRGGITRWTRTTALSMLPSWRRGQVKEQAVSHVATVGRILEKIRKRDTSSNHSSSGSVGGGNATVAAMAATNRAATDFFGCRFGPPQPSPSPIALVKMSRQTDNILVLAHLASAVTAFFDPAEGELRTITVALACVYTLLCALFFPASLYMVLGVSAFVWFSPFADRFRYILLCVLRYRREAALVYNEMNHALEKAERDR